MQLLKNSGNQSAGNSSRASHTGKQPLADAPATTASKVRIRLYSRKDAADVWSLHMAVTRHLEATTNYRYDPSTKWDEKLKDIPTHFNRKGGAFVVAHLDGHLVGIAGFHAVDPLSKEFRESGPNSAELEMFRVEPGHQGQGIGRRILEQIENLASKRGFGKIVFKTSEYQEKAMRLYASTGYQLVRRVPAEWDLAVYERFYEKQI